MHAMILAAQLSSAQLDVGLLIVGSFILKVFDTVKRYYTCNVS